MTEPDLRSTLNLPRTDFPMKANLSQAEPRRLEQWKAQDLYGQIRAARKGCPSFVLHDGPPYANGHIHLGTVLNKILKDVIVRSRSAAGKDAPYRPGWDCHGLPIELKVDRDLGSKKREMSPLAFRQACRAYAEKFVGIQREEFERLGVLGEWQDPYLTMSPSYQATIVRQLATFAEKGLVYKAKKSVHWCILPHRPRRGRGRVRREPRQPPGRRSLPARRGGPGSPGAVAPGPRRQARLRRHLDDDPLDAPRQPRPRRSPRRRLRLLPARGHGRRPGDREGAARGLRGPMAREGQPGRRPAGARRAPRRGEGRGPRAPALPPPLDRPRLPRPAGRLRHPRHRHRDRPHRPRPRLGRLPHRRPLRARRLLSRGRGGAVPARGRALRRAEGLRRQPEDRRLPPRDGRPAAVRQGHPLLPDLLALQEPDHLPRHRAVVHRPRRRPAHACASRPSRRSPRRGGFPPGARSASAT